MPSQGNFIPKPSVADRITAAEVALVDGMPAVAKMLLSKIQLDGVPIDRGLRDRFLVVVRTCRNPSRFERTIANLVNSDRLYREAQQDLEREAGEGVKGA